LGLSLLGICCNSDIWVPDLKVGATGQGGKQSKKLLLAEDIISNIFVNYFLWIFAGVYPFWIPAFAGMTGRDRDDISVCHFEFRFIGARNLIIYL
jgi:hypothetical protein